MDPNAWLREYSMSRYLRHRPDADLERRLNDLGANIWSTDMAGEVIPLPDGSRRGVLLRLIADVLFEKAQRAGQAQIEVAFSPNAPVLAFNALSDQPDKDEQQGMMRLFQGAVLALRNPRAHTVSEDSPELALDAIAFLSMLAKRLDTARRI